MSISKDTRGDIGLTAWSKNNGQGTLHYTMQFGKTYVGIKLIKTVYNKNPLAKVIVLVPNEIVKKNWNYYIAAHLNDTPALVEVITFHRLINMVKTKELLDCSVLIIDEIHKIVTPEIYICVLKINQKFVLGLTGTYPTNIEDKKKIDAIAPVIDVITEQEAIANGWVAPFMEYNYMLEFTEEDKLQYYSLSKPINETLQLFYTSAKTLNTFFNFEIFKNDYEVIESCIRGVVFQANIYSEQKTRFEGYSIRAVLANVKGWDKNLNLSGELEQQINHYWSPEAIEHRCKEFLILVRNRNNLMIMHPLKLQAVTDIVQKFKKPTIVFNESTDFADLIAQSINRLQDDDLTATVYHSYLNSRPLRDENGEYYRYKSGAKKGEIKLFGKDTLKAEAIEGFKRGHYKVISTAKALDVGLSVPNIEFVITTGGTTNPMTYQQRAARGKTIDIYNTEKCTIIVNVVFNDFIIRVDNEEIKVKSRDMTKLLLRQEYKPLTEWVDCIEDIKP